MATSPHVPGSDTTEGSPADSVENATENSTAEYDAAMQWLDTLDPATSPATVVAQEVRDVADAVDRVHTAEEDLLAAVLRARAAGASWNDLALALGVSRQAARQRFAPLEKAATVTAMGTAQPAS